MTQEDKELLVKDLSGRLTHGVKGLALGGKVDTINVFVPSEFPWVKTTTGLVCHLGSGQFKPYLRPMSSMTMEEKIELCTRAYAPDETKTIDEKLHVIKINAKNATDFYNEHHLDFRGLIEKGLAIAVTEENNPYN